MTKVKIAKETRKRLEIMTSTTDGFIVAEADLKMRGPGDLEGTMQSGIAFDLHIANLATDGQIIQMARNTASDILDLDPDLTMQNHAILRNQLDVLFAKSINWGLIS